MENRWLQSLRKDIQDKREIEPIIRDYEEKKNSKLYEAAMEVITRANWDTIKEVKGTMCEALRELMAEEIEEEKKIARSVGEEMGKEIGKKEERTQMIRNAYDSICDVGQVAQILKIPVDFIKEIVEVQPKISKI
ncbi:MAG: hypothetical protein EOM40_11025 [Clostridia bacterium]|nr:hypothetical protein [Clostridia bacterium]NCC43152.1 hypothetical protein [Clostridia bacterium]